MVKSTFSPQFSKVDGDTDNVSVQREFERVIRQQTTRLGHTTAYRVPQQQQQQTSSSIASSSTRRSANAILQQHDTIDLEDLDNVPGTVPTISNHISLIQNNNGSKEPDSLNNNYANHVNKTTTNNTSSKHNNNNHTDANGVLPAGTAAVANGPKTFRSMLEEAETYPIDL